MQIRNLAVILVDNAGERIERKPVEIVQVSATFGAEVERYRNDDITCQRWRTLRWSRLSEQILRVDKWSVCWG